VPLDLNDIILMAIAKKPEERFQSAAAFHGALATLGVGIGPAKAQAEVVSTRCCRYPSRFRHFQRRLRHFQRQR